MNKNKISEVMPPAGLPTDPILFWAAGGPWSDLKPPTDADATPALKKLGPLPIPRGKFPLLGLLATIYEHVAVSAQTTLGQSNSAVHNGPMLEGEIAAEAKPS